MSEAKFTAGPWAIFYHPDGILIRREYDERTVCVIGPDEDLGDLTQEDHANANLIAAAPALLACLESVANLLEADYGPHTLKMIAVNLAKDARAAGARHDRMALRRTRRHKRATFLPPYCRG
jgi:hypothetical protein